MPVGSASVPCRGVEGAGGHGPALALVAVHGDGVGGVGAQVRQVGLPVDGADAVVRRVRAVGGRAAGAAATPAGRLVVPRAAVVVEVEGRAGGRDVGHADARRAVGRCGNVPGLRVGRGGAGAGRVDGAQAVAVFRPVGQAAQGVRGGGRAAVRDALPRSPAGEFAGRRVVVVHLVLVAADRGIGRVVPGEDDAAVTRRCGQPGRRRQRRGHGRHVGTGGRGVGPAAPGVGAVPCPHADDVGGVCCRRRIERPGGLRVIHGAQGPALPVVGGVGDVVGGRRWPGRSRRR